MISMHACNCFKLHADDAMSAKMTKASRKLLTSDSGRKRRGWTCSFKLRHMMLQEFSRLMHPQPSASASTAAGSSDSMGKPAGGDGLPQEIWFQTKVVLKGMAASQDS